MSKKVKKKAAPPTLAPILVSRDEAAAMLGIKWSTLFSYEQRGILRPVALPSTARRRPQDARLRRVLYSIDDLRAFVARQKE